LLNEQQPFYIPYHGTQGKARRRWPQFTMVRDFPVKMVFLGFDYGNGIDPLNFRDFCKY